MQTNVHHPLAGFAVFKIRFDFSLAACTLQCLASSIGASQLIVFSLDSQTQCFLDALANNLHLT